MMLGPSIVAAGTPIAAVTALVALRGGRERPWAIASALLASVEVLFLIAMLVILSAGR